ncbi:MAG: GMC oxidoreductase [Pseudomonadota bacterium]
MTSHEADYIIVGGGSAGCILARRLSDAGIGEVLLIEAGSSDEGDPVATQLSRLGEQDDSYDWGYAATPFPGGPKTIAYPRARMLGGCGNHNDCAFMPPHPFDLDRWERLGAAGWSSHGLQAAQARLENQTNIEDSPVGAPIGQAFIAACRELGLPERQFRDGLEAGAGWFPLNAKGDLRNSSSVAYLHPLADRRSTLDVLTGVTVSRLVIDDQTCVGVETDRGIARARREVVLCAGAINTPQIMMLSGLGPAEHLTEHGIDSRVDLPGVGQNLLDHAAASVVVALKQPVAASERTPWEATALIRLDEDAPAPDALFHFAAVAGDKADVHKAPDAERSALVISPNVAGPKSRGWVELANADPNAPPRIDLNYFSDAEGYDQRILGSALRFARRIAATEALGPFAGTEIRPGTQVESDDALFAYMRERCETVYHASGTCRMGRADDRLSVVTPDLRVKGVKGLRIADASVFPDMVTANINNTVMLVAEQASLLITGDPIN